MPESHILDFSIVVLIWFGYWCYTFRVSHYLFQPNYFVLHFNDWFSVLSNKFIIFWYSIIILSWIFCLSYGHIYISLGIFLSNPIFSVSLSTVLELLCGEVLETYQRFNCQSNQSIKSNCFYCFLNCCFWNSFKCIIAWSRSFWTYLLLTFFPMLLPILFLIFLTKDDNT